MIGLGVSVTRTAQAATLLDVFERARQSDPQLLQADAIRQANKEIGPQVLGTLMPQINAFGNASRRRTVGPLSSTNPSASDPKPTADYTVKSYTLQLTQSVFHWDQWAALKRADAQVAQAEAAYLAAEQDLIVRVAQRYFAVLAAQDSVNTTQAAVEAFSRQLDHAEKRFGVGLMAITDVQEARAQRDRSVADAIDAKRTLATNIGLLREITGTDFDSLAAPGEDMPLKTPEPASEDKWVNAATEQNLNLISARLNFDIARQNVRIAEAGHAPSLDLVLSYGDTNTRTSITSTDGIEDPTTTAKQNNRSIGVQLTVPIFSGGVTQSRVRQQVSLRRAALENLELVTRQTERSVRDNYLGVLSGISRVKALRQAFESSRIALQATEAGFEVGTRTTVDVLLSRQQFFAAQTAYSQSRYTYLQSLIQLEQAAGQLNRDNVEEINDWLK